MAFLDGLIPGGIGVSGGQIVGGLSTFAKFLGIGVLLAVFIGLWLYNKNNKKLYNKNIPIFEEVNGQFQHRPKLDDQAMELTIPGTTVRVFHLKKHNIYLPRGTIMMADGEYWYGIRKNREWVNFAIKNLNKEMKEAGLDYDHTDMIYANNQLKKLLAKSYKKEKWWQEFRQEIAIAILILLLTFSFWFLIGKVNEGMALCPDVLKTSKEVLETSRQVIGALDNICGGSGIRPAG